MLARRAGGAATSKGIVCTGPLKYAGQSQVKAELDLFKSALRKRTPLKHSSPRYLSTTPPTGLPTSTTRPKREFLTAIADAMNEEYKTIVDAGFLLQIDDPQLATIYMRKGSWSIDDYKRWANARVEFLNYATAAYHKRRSAFIPATASISGRESMTSS